jgi:hypothetical protein
VLRQPSSPKYGMISTGCNRAATSGEVLALCRRGIKNARRWSFASLETGGSNAGKRPSIASIFLNATAYSSVSGRFAGFALLPKRKLKERNSVPAPPPNALFCRSSDSSAAHQHIDLMNAINSCGGLGDAGQRSDPSRAAGSRPDHNAEKRAILTSGNPATTCPRQSV